MGARHDRYPRDGPAKARSSPGGHAEGAPQGLSGMAPACQIAMRPRPTYFRAMIMAGALACQGASAPATAGDQRPPEADTWALCADFATRAEQAHRLPRGLLRAIAKVESGRYEENRREVLAWPWTVMAEGRGRYLPSKAAAIAEVEALQARGIRNIDVGCMQINLRYHPDAFVSLEAAFDPAANVEAAARLLLDLRDAWGSWTRAVGNYHSNTPTLSGPYRVKVYRTLYKDRRDLAKSKRRGKKAG